MNRIEFMKELLSTDFLFIISKINSDKVLELRVALLESYMNEEEDKILCFLKHIKKRL